MFGHWILHPTFDQNVAYKPSTVTTTKSNNKYCNNVETVPESNRKIVDSGKIDTPNIILII
jgi:hypothetical protein